MLQDNKNKLNKRSTDENISVLLIDIDDFKKVNDIY